MIYESYSIDIKGIFVRLYVDIKNKCFKDNFTAAYDFMRCKVVKQKGF